MTKKLKLKDSLSALLRQKEQTEIAARKRALATGTGKSSEAKAKASVGKRRLPPFPYSFGDRILAIGEGNFSFTRAVAQVLEVGCGITATSYDDEAVVHEKYADAADHIRDLQERAATVMYGVDGTALEKCKALRGQRFTHIVFNFPHTGSGIKDMNVNVLGNQKLILGFLTSAVSFLTDPERFPDTDLVPGQIHLATKTGMPYDLWRVRDVAHNTGQLVCTKCDLFYPDHFPGYEHRRTLGFQEGRSVAQNAEITKAKARLYVFVRGNYSEYMGEKKVADRKNEQRRKHQQKLLKKHGPHSELVSGLGKRKFDGKDN
ncbi:hypothetical protein IWQ60_000494 [Tieghemiomyces parasiticus]|uniref:25S rRNA (uridine-N(3))-methyltransferase BMT5-like domain-containing protein n=1 Tax=Tieghemiomyces parasiticus TaxID=78921 RepID=A0A9W8ALN2_9FUNG|nr:hypothetical protein IWQ60_000494 [Tieghemiomyces parasiticus]